MAIEIKTHRYVFSHGRQPRGRGTWAFEIAGVTHFAPSGWVYKDACGWAREKAREVGAQEIFVLP